MLQKSPNMPRVFISSTVEDLESYREAVKEAAFHASFYPVMMEYFTSGSVRRPLAECMHKVDECDVLVVIVAYRYGWIPDDQETDEKKSIAWLECERATVNGKEVLAFFVHSDYDWPEDKKEDFRIIKARREKKNVAAIMADVDLAEQKFPEFKSWLDKVCVRNTFKTEEDLKTKVTAALFDWRSRQPATFKTVEQAVSDPTKYLNWLQDECAFISIRGLQVSSGKAHKFPIEELYIPLTTTGDIGKDRSRKKDKELMEHSRRIELHHVLKEKQVTIIGDPGSGKTTFLRRIAFNLCQSLLLKKPDTAEERLGLTDTPFPVFIRLSELSEHITNSEKDRPSLKTDPTWLPHFLADRSDCQTLGLDREFFQDKLTSGDAILLLDGLDEAPDRKMRETLSELVTRAIKAYNKCRFVVTSRPQAYEGNTILLDFQQYIIDALEDDAIENFLMHWSHALHHNDPTKAKEHLDELLEALQNRSEIRRIARNPVMLTAMAVVHWNESRLPEQRADLYESIITWLSRSRQQRPGRMGAKDCVKRLQDLALAMQTHKDGRQTQVGRRWVAEAIQANFSGDTEEQRIFNAENFLAEEEVDSGIIVGRGNQISYWHLTFQEYLTAKALGGKSEQQQKSILIKPDILYSQEWREVLLLFGGVLYNQGLDKVNNFFFAVLDLTESKTKSLTDEARSVGLIGAMLRDLSPFDYQLTDARYPSMLDRVMGIFDKEKAKNIDVKVRLEAAEALGQAGDPRFHEDNMIYIPAGTFLMGAQSYNSNFPNYDPDANPDELPVHKVHLSAFKISRYLVTVGQYQRFIKDDGYSKEIYWKAGGFRQFKEPENWEQQLQSPTRPIVGVSWYEAKAYSNWCGLDLPTEAQWERAAKGPSMQYKKYPWGDEDPNGKITSSSYNMLGQLTPVGMFPDDCTAEGILDMGGNVREWCKDWRDVDIDEQSIFYAKSEFSHDPVNDEAGEWGLVGNHEYTVLRGGSWNNYDTHYFRCAVRFYDHPVIRINIFGFRLACSVQH
ncbi:MAG: SUMF1/EgtB/PvdO family nonheme iron enzyme [Candidatus Lokiarchaeota archaeon]|nr:SUMF1/EgtB/PvdO family nonheme iron enzyme [Candidatus Lokiarchaeota archaeon]